MPVILEQPDWPMWLGEAEGDYAALLRLAPDGLPKLWPVDRRGTTGRSYWKASPPEPVAVPHR